MDETLLALVSYNLLCSSLMRAFVNYVAKVFGLRSIMVVCESLCHGELCSQVLGLRSNCGRVCDNENYVVGVG